MSKKKIKSVELDEKYERIKFLLNRSFYKDSDDAVNHLYNKVKEYAGIDDSCSATFFIEKLEDFLLSTQDNNVFYHSCYFHKKINPIVVYLVCDRLIAKNLKASKRIIHELCYQAESSFYDGFKYESFSHAVNGVIKIYSELEWFTPYGFLDEFPEYKNKI